MEDLENVTHFAGGTVSMNCSASSVLLANMVWYKNNEQIFEDERVKIFNTIDSGNSNKTVVRSTLLFTNLTQSDDADYFCEASNLGAVRTNFIINSSVAHLTIQCELTFSSHLVFISLFCLHLAFHLSILHFCQLFDIKIHECLLCSSIMTHLLV